MTTTTSGKPTLLDDDVFEKELDAFIEDKEKQESPKQEDNKNKKEGQGRTQLTEDNLDQELEHIEKGQKESQEKKTRPGDDSGPSDNEDSEPDDYNITEDQKRALEELDILKNELGYDDPPVYDVTERLKQLNEELAKDETPVEGNREHKVGFKEDPVDLVVPPMDYGTDEENEKTDKKTSGESEPDDKSEVIKEKNKNKTDTKQKNRVLVERGGHFELVSSDDVKASDLGLPTLIDTSTSDNKENQVKKQPSPPGKPRPSTANGHSRRTVRPAAKQERPKSAGTYPSHTSNSEYYSPYGLTKKQKELAEKQAKANEQKKKEEERRKKEEHEQQQREANEAFEFWLKKKKEEDRRKKIEEEEERKKNEKKDRGQEEESEELEQAFKNWLKEKNSQVKQEKLLKKREQQEQHDGFYLRKREDCDKAYRDWLKHKNAEIRKARAMERQRAKAHRLAARRARKSQSLARAIRQSQAFRYVDYYGYRF